MSDDFVISLLFRIFFVIINQIAFFEGGKQFLIFIIDFKFWSTARIKYFEIIR